MDCRERSFSIIERANELAPNSNFHITGFELGKTVGLLQAILEDHDKQVHVIHIQTDPQIEVLKRKLTAAELTINEYHKFESNIESETGVDVDQIADYVKWLERDRVAMYDALVKIEQTLLHHALKMRHSPTINTIWMKDAVDHETLFDYITSIRNKIEQQTYRKETV